jgi:cation diffusion facilitator family transporter
MIQWVRSLELGELQKHKFKNAIAITLAGNIVLAVIKSIAAYSSNSTAIYTDAINSVSDVIYSFFLVAGLRLSQKPPDISHPQGHSRFEPLSALIVTLSMGLAGAEALRASIVRFLSGGSIISFGISSLALFISFLIKTIMFLMINKIGDQLSSPGLKAAAKDNISDAVTSISAILGVAGAAFINPLFDPIAGFFVSIWIFKSVWQTAKLNLGYLTGAGADPLVRQKILECVRNIDGVKNVHHIITEYAGPKLVVEMHINADGGITLDQAHQICDEASSKLESLPEVDRAYVHIEPIGHD